MSGTAPEVGGGKSRRAALAGRLALGAVFLAALAVTSIWVIRSFMQSAPRTIVLAPDAVDTARAIKPAARARVGRQGGFEPPTFSGKVADAATHEPIGQFQVRLGYTFGTGQPMNFTAAPIRQFNGGHYKATAPFYGGNGISWKVRVEAAGHLPADSALIQGTATQDFELTAAADLQGRVVDASGAPVAGAVVALSVPWIQADIDDSLISTKVFPSLDDMHTRTGSDGRFTYHPQSGMVGLAAISDQGYGQIVRDASSKDWTIQLAAWGRIQGTLTIAAKPGPAQEIAYYSMEYSDSTHPTNTKRGSAQTDGDGHFHFDRVPPGLLYFGRVYKWKNGPASIQTFTQTEPVTVGAGQTVTVNIGGAGRPVTGRLVLPQGAGKWSSYFINQTVSGTQEPSPPPAMPEKVRNSGSDVRALWMNLYRLTPAGRQYLAAHPEPPVQTRNYAMEVGTDGKFRIEDVVAGDYRIWINVNPLSPGQRSGQAQAEFSMPAVPGGGYSDQPLTIPDIIVRLN